VRLKWFKSLNPTLQFFILLGLILFLVVFYIPLSKYLKPTITSVLSPSLRISKDISAGAREFLSFQDLIEENKQLKTKLDNVSAQLIQLEEADQENQRLHELLSLPREAPYKRSAALVIGKDSSNWTKTLIINQGASSGIEKDMPVALGINLVGKVVETSASTSKVVLLIDFNSKIPAKIKRTREEGIVVGGFSAGRTICRIKYIQEAEIGDKVISSGLGGVYPKGLLIGKITEVREEKHKLYKTAEVEPAVDFSRLEEVMVIMKR